MCGPRYSGLVLEDRLLVCSAEAFFSKAFTAEASNSLHGKGRDRKPRRRWLCARLLVDGWARCGGGRAGEGRRVDGNERVCGDEEEEVVVLYCCVVCARQVGCWKLQ